MAKRTIRLAYHPREDILTYFRDNEWTLSYSARGKPPTMFREHSVYHGHFSRAYSKAYMRIDTQYIRQTAFTLSVETGITVTSDDELFLVELALMFGSEG